MLYFIRHGQTDWNLDNKIQGVCDTALNKVGRAQAHQAAEQLNGIGLKRIVSSDLVRASETAQIIGNTLKIPVEYDARLREYDFGEFNGRNQLALIKNFAVFNQNPGAFGAERMENAFARVGNFLLSVDYDINTLVVSHGGTMRFIMYLANYGTEFNIDTFMQKVIPTHIGNATIFQIAQKGHRLERLG